MPDPETPQPFHFPAWVLESWWGPPTNILPHSLGLTLTLARTEAVAVTLEHFDIYPEGFSFDLVVRAATDDAGWSDDFDISQHETEHGILPERLRFGVEFPDGSKATNFDGSIDPEHLPPASPVLQQHAGGRGGRYSEQSFWLWPIPPPGKFAFECEWPDAGIEPTRIEVDAQPFIDAAKRTDELFPTGSIGGPGWSVIGHVAKREDEGE